MFPVSTHAPASAPCAYSASIDDPAVCSASSEEHFLNLYGGAVLIVVVALVIAGIAKRIRRHLDGKKP
jgi:hypothetical protein